MAVLEWDKTGERTYETGISKGVFYPMSDNNDYPKGYAWNGLSSVSENPSGAESTSVYADNIKYLNLISAEDFGATIEAYTAPDEFAICDGSAAIATGVSVRQQTRKKFGLCYRTEIGNDAQGENFGYKLHLVYNCTAAPSEHSYSTINDSPEADTMSWEITTTAEPIPGYKASATITIDSTKVAKEKLTALEAMLYGTESEDAKLPTPKEIIDLFKSEG